MKYLASLAAIALLAACSQGPGHPGGPGGGPPPGGMGADGGPGGPGGPHHFTASPSQLVAASARLTSAIRESDEPADIFRDYFIADAPVLGETFTSVENMGLSREKMLLEFLKSDVRRIAISCDGKTGVTAGAFDTDESYKSYELIWEKDDKAEWRVAFVHLDASPESGPAPEFIRSNIASCANLPDPTGEVRAANGTYLGDSAADGSLSWEIERHWDSPTEFVLKLWNGSEWMQPFD